MAMSEESSAIDNAIQKLISDKVKIINEDDTLKQQAEQYYKDNNDLDASTILTDKQTEEAVNSLAAGLVGASLSGLSAREQAKRMGLDDNLINQYEIELKNAEFQRTYQANLQQKYSDLTEKYGFDEDKVKNLTELFETQADRIDDLSDSMKGDSLASMELTEDLLRYDEAVVSVKEHYED